MQLIYVFGEPGAGKSTMIRDAIGDLLKTGFKVPHPFRHIIFPFNGGLAAYLGSDNGKEPFPGTDRLSMGVQPAAVRLLKDNELALAGIKTIIAEGDRLGTISFFEAAREAGYKIIAIHAKSSRAAQARAERASQTGQEQSKTWLKGRLTKVERLAKHCQETEGITYATIQADQKRPRAGRELLKLLGIKP